MTAKKSPKLEALEQIRLAKSELEKAIKNFNGENCLQTVKQLQKSRDHLHVADGMILDKHLKECLPKLKSDSLTQEIVKTFKYSHK